MNVSVRTRSIWRANLRAIGLDRFFPAVLACLLLGFSGEAGAAAPSVDLGEPPHAAVSARSPGAMRLAQTADEAEEKPYASEDEAEADCAGAKNAERLRGCSYLLENAELEPARLAKTLGLRGYANLVKRDTNLAIVDFNKSLDLKPGNRDILILRGLAYRWMGDTELAIADLTAAIEIDPEFAGAYADRAVAHQAGGDIEAALKDFSTAIELKPDDPYAYVTRAAAYAGRDEFDLALADYARALELKPEDSKTLRDRGHLYMALGKPGKAVADFTSAIKHFPRDSRSYRARGLARAIEGAYSKAITDLEKAAEIAPKVRETFHIRGSIYEKLTRIDLALADYDKILELRKTDVVALAGRARMLALAEKGDEAVMVADELIADAPARPEPYLARGFVHAHLADTEKALGDIDMALALGAESPSTLVEGASVLNTIGEHAGALAIVNSVLEDGTRNLRALEVRATAYEASGEGAGAIKDSTTVLIARPSIDAYLVRARVRATNGDMYRAIRDYGQILKLNPDHGIAQSALVSIMKDANTALANNPDDADALTTRAWVYLTRKKNQAALADFGKAVKLAPDNPTIYFGAGLLLADAGKKDVALKLFGDAIARKPDFAAALYQRGFMNATYAKYGPGVLDLAEAASLDPEQMRDATFLDNIMFPVTMTMRMQPKNVGLVTARGLIHWLQGNLDDAIKDLDDAHAREPENAATLLWRGRVHGEAGDTEKAITDLEMARGLAPDDARITGELEKLRAPANQ